MKKIVYLGPDYSDDLVWMDNNDRDEQIVAHPNREVYSVEEFAEAFNTEAISDLGYIVVVDDERTVNDLRP